MGVNTRETAREHRRVLGFPLSSGSSMTFGGDALGLSSGFCRFPSDVWQNRNAMSPLQQEVSAMSTLRLSLPEALRLRVEAQIKSGQPARNWGGQTTLSGSLEIGREQWPTPVFVPVCPVKVRHELDV